MLIDNKNKPQEGRKKKMATETEKNAQSRNEKPTKEVTKSVAKMTLPELLETKAVQQRFLKVLGTNAASFLASLITIWTEDEKLKDCEAVTILSAAKQAAVLNLPIMKQLGYAYIIPYEDWKTGKQVAQFQLGYKGLLQLAMRSGVFKNLNTAEIYEGEIESRNRITGEVVIDEEAATTGEVVGYVAYMELMNGFRKMLYMTRSEVEKHAAKYSASYAYDLKTGKRKSVWSTNFDAMAKKTVLKLLLSRYAPTSIEMQSGELTQALQADQALVTPDGGYQYVDIGGNGNKTDGNIENSEAEIIDAETDEVKEAKAKAKE